MRFYNDLAIRNSINETPNIKSWSLSWTDVLTFESENEENQIDELFVNKNRYTKSIKVLKKLPATSILTAGLWDTKNSIERLLWYLQNSNSSHISSEFGLLALSFQEEFGSKAFSSYNAEKLMNGELNVDTEQPNGDSYLISDLTQSNDLFKVKVFGRLKDFDVLSKLEAAQLENIDKEEWEKFLRLYTLINL